MKNSFVVFAILLLATCGYSDQQLAQRPIAWSITTPVPVQPMSTCLGITSAGRYKVRPIYSPERTVLVLADDFNDWASYEIQPAEQGSIVALRQMPMLITENQRGRLAREAVEHCSKLPLG